MCPLDPFFAVFFTWMSNHISQKTLDVIRYPCPGLTYNDRDEIEVEGGCVGSHVDRDGVPGNWLSQVPAEEEEC